MKPYILVHQHEYGETVAIVQSLKDLLSPSLNADEVNELARQAGFDFDPDLNESILIHELRNLEPITVFAKETHRTSQQQQTSI
ncbi:MAG: hypothetical protein JNM09_00355 [Blastocatellia bacterium]|nr:hypothetical protein [Blastocatellia bacterium]